MVATGNPGKLKEIAAILAPLGLQARPQSEWGFKEAVEDGLSFVENALIKARHAARHTGLPALADDSGLVVPALGGAPGIYSARYAPEANAAANNRKLLATLEAGLDRSAHFFCAMVYMRTDDDPVPLIATGQWQGEILEAPRGEGGFGYDPLFWVPDHQCSAAELPSEVKNTISHRGLALAELVKRLKA